MISAIPDYEVDKLTEVTDSRINEPGNDHHFAGAGQRDLDGQDHLKGGSAE